MHHYVYNHIKVSVFTFLKSHICALRSAKAEHILFQACTHQSVCHTHNGPPHTRTAGLWLAVAFHLYSFYCPSNRLGPKITALFAQALSWKEPGDLCSSCQPETCTSLAAPPLHQGVFHPVDPRPPNWRVEVWTSKQSRDEGVDWTKTWFWSQLLRV